MKDSCANKPPFDPVGGPIGDKSCGPGCGCSKSIGSGVGGGLNDNCDSCTVTDSMLDMMMPPCPMGGRRKRRAVLESSEEQGLNISPSPSVELDIKR